MQGYGAMKIETIFGVALQGHPGKWACEDVQAHHAQEVVQNPRL